jgi:hypothetical protein
MVDAELRLVDRVPAELQPQLVSVQPAMKGELVPLGVVNLDVKNRGFVDLGPQPLLSVIPVKKSNGLNGLNVLNHCRLQIIASAGTAR